MQGFSCWTQGNLAKILLLVSQYGSRACGRLSLTLEMASFPPICTTLDLWSRTLAWWLRTIRSDSGGFPHFYCSLQAAMAPESSLSAYRPAHEIWHDLAQPTTTPVIWRCPGKERGTAAAAAGLPNPPASPKLSPDICQLKQRPR